MKERRYLVPCEGRTLRFPLSRRLLPPGGAWVEWTVYWMRKVRDGDCTEGAPPRAAAPSTPDAPPASVGAEE